MRIMEKQINEIYTIDLEIEKTKKHLVKLEKRRKEVLEFDKDFWSQWNEEKLATVEASLDN